MRHAINVIINLIIIIIILGSLVFVHELGHFLVAKFSGMYVEEFSLGMGPRLLKFQGKETVYSLRIFPIGGFVKILGEEFDDDLEEAMSGSADEDADNKDTVDSKEGTDSKEAANSNRAGSEIRGKLLESELNPKTDPRSFINKPLVHRLAVILAGVTMNLLLAACCFYAVLALKGFVWRADAVLEEINPVIGNVTKELFEDESIYYSVAEDGNAVKTSIPDQGIVKSVNGVELKYSSDFLDIVSQKAGEQVKIDVCPIDKETFGILENEMCGVYEVEVNNEGKVGVYIYPNYSILISYEGVSRIFSGFGHMTDQVRLMGYYIPRFVRSSLERKDYKTLAVGSVSSPVGLYFLVDAVKETGGLNVLHLLGMMSMMLALVNILPIPALDGGRAVLIIVEGLIGHPLNKRLEGAIIQISFYLLMAFMLIVFLKDIVFIKALSSMFR
ncbi:hypothetical protein GF357_03820 [Candidatus Dojkabacteria bacterium]|nr:hypothetical protein [Candidatus Dojkabacteria bacterium]